MSATPSGNGVWRWGRWLEESPPRRVVSGAEVRLLQFNMCGSACNEGEVDRVSGSMVRTMLEDPPDIALLNEVCLAQADKLVEKLEGAGLRYSGAFGSTSGTTRCPGPPGERWYGNLVLCRSAGLGEPTSQPLPNRAHLHEKRATVTMDTDLFGVPVTVTSVHLAPWTRDEEFNRLQAAEVIRVQNSLAATGRAVVVGGDFNALPEFLAGFGPPGGHFREVDHSRNSPTMGRRKIDHIFLSAGDFSEVRAQVVAAAHSDHRMLRARALLVGRAK